MTLVFIFFLYGLFGASPAARLRAIKPPQSATQSTPEAAPFGSQQQDQKTGTAPASESQPASSQPLATTKPKASQAAKKSHQKRPTNSDCGTAPASSAAGSSSAGGQSGKSAAADNSDQAAKAAAPAKNCAPQKIIVRQGGAPEPSIQLAGTDQSSQQKNAATQLLGTTEENLKKISGRQLSSDQQDTITQIHQFVQQSKAAAADGDLERARNLAWKAELLSEDLVNPQK